MSISAIHTVNESSRSTADVVAGNIRAEAARLGIKQIELGRALGMSQSAITTRWKGLARWQLEELDDVADVLGITVQDLVTDHPQKRRTPAGGSHRGGPLRARRDSNPQPSDLEPNTYLTCKVVNLHEWKNRRAS